MNRSTKCLTSFNSAAREIAGKAQRLRAGATAGLSSSECGIQFKAAEMIQWRMLALGFSLL